LFGRYFEPVGDGSRKTSRVPPLVVLFMLLQVFLVLLLFPLLIVGVNNTGDTSFWKIADDLNTDAHKSELENNVAIAITKIRILFMTRILLVLISYRTCRFGLIHHSKKKRRDFFVAASAALCHVT
jgi:hypothetical protein